MRIVYFSPVTYDSYPQRPHFMIASLLSQGASRVLWVDPYPNRLPRISDLRFSRFTSAAGNPPENIEVRRVFALPIEPLPGGAALNAGLFWRRLRAEVISLARQAPCLVGIGRPGALAAWASENLPQATTFFDAMDDFPAFYRGLSRYSMARWERRVAAHADHILCSSHMLVHKYADKATRTILIPNGCQMQSSHDNSDARSSSVIGYIGTVGEWFDWPLVVEMAHALPDVAVHVVGPQLAASPRTLPQNVRLFPACFGEEAVRHMCSFTVGLIPFRRSRLTACVDPIKYYEYRAFGMPVWSTDFGEMVQRGDQDAVVKIASGSDWRGLWSRREQLFPDAYATHRFNVQNSWQQRFAGLLETLLARRDSTHVTRGRHAA